MKANTPQITLDEAYWWLNFTCANLVRPSLRVLLKRLDEAVKDNEQKLAQEIVEKFIDNEIHSMNSPLLDQAKQLLTAVKIWNKSEIEKACQKFTDCGGSYLHNPIYSTVLTMREAVEYNTELAWNTLESLNIMKNKIADGLEAGELLVECGWVAYKLQNRARAAWFLEQANRRYNSRNHQTAVVFCMLGGLYWELGQQSKALVAWRNSISRFSTLAEQRLVPAEADVVWYQSVLERLNEALEYLVEKKERQQPTKEPEVAPQAPGETLKAQEKAHDGDQDAQRGADTTPEKTPESSTESGTGDKSEKPPITTTDMPSGSDEFVETYTGDFLEMYPILDEVPAGPWKEVYGDPNIIGRLDIGEVVIDDKLFSVKSIHNGDRQITLPSGAKFAVLKIKGNSMNAARPTPIEDGDFVLVRVKESASSNDIVVANVDDEITGHQKASVKRYKNHGHPQLLPESTDPKNKPLEGKIYIFGVVLAVFKPVGKADTKPA